MRKKDHFSGLLKILCVGVLLLGVAACGSRIDSRGNLLDPDKLASIKIGESTRNQVNDILGSPSSIAAFDNNIWYYISERTETVAFLEPDIRKRQIIILNFDDHGVVADIKTVGLKDGRVVNYIKRETPTAGNEMSIIDQVIANFSRFKKQTQKKLNK